MLQITPFIVSNDGTILYNVAKSNSRLIDALLMSYKDLHDYCLVNEAIRNFYYVSVDILLMIDEEKIEITYRDRIDFRD